MDARDESLNLEFDNLLKKTAQSLGMDATDLRNKLQGTWFETREWFDCRHTTDILTQIQIIGNYSIAQIELIGDGIRVNINFMPSEICAKHVKNMIEEGATFDLVMRWLLMSVN